MLKKNRAWCRFGRLGIRRRIALACREGPLPLLQGPQPLAASMKILWGGVLAVLPSGRRFKAVTSEELLRPNYSREGGPWKRKFPGGVWPNYSGEGSSGTLLSGKRLGRITLGKVAQGKITLWKVARPKYSREIGSGKLLSGKCFGRITFGKVGRGNHSREGGSGKLLSGKSFGRKRTLGKVFPR